MHPFTPSTTAGDSLFRRLLNVPYIPLWMLKDEALVAMMESATEVHVIDGDRPISPKTKAKSNRAFNITRDADGCTHSEDERRKAVLAFIAAAVEDLGEDAAVTVAGPLPELGGAKVFLMLPESELVRPAETPA